MKARPNPFALPSPTDLRFGLLVASILGASLYVYTLLYLAFPGNGEAFARALGACEGASQSASLSDDPTRLVAVQTCLAPLYRVQALWVAAGILVLLATTCAIFWTYPRWMIRRNRLRPLLMDDSPELVGYLGDLCRDAGLRVRPRFFANPEPTTSCVAFGRPGRCYVALGGRLVTLYSTDQPVFRAIVLHELSHLRNADVSKACLSLALSVAFGLAALTPLAVVLVATRLAAPTAGGALPGAPELTGLAMAALAVAGAAIFAWVAFVRSREAFADLRVIQVGGPESSLTAGLGRLPSLLEIGFWDVLASGLVGAIAFVGLQPYVSLVLSGTWASGWSSAIASAVFVPLAGGVVGLGIWRDALAEKLGADRMPLWRLGLGLWLGLIVGRALSFTGSVLPPSRGAPALGPSLLLAGALLVICLFFVYWVRDGALAWIEAAFAEGGLRITCAVGLSIVGVVLSLCLSAVFLFVDPLRAARLGTTVTLAGLSLAFKLPTEPLAPAALLALWAYPLSAYLWRRPGPTAVPTWARFDQSGEPPPAAAPPDLGVRRSLVVGAIGGLLSGGLLAMLVLAFASGGLSGDEEGSTMLVLELCWVASAQAAASAIAADRAAHLRLEQGLLAAFVAACLQTVCWAVQSLALGTLDPGSVWSFLSYSIVLGGMLSLVAAGVVAALAGSRGRAQAPRYGPSRSAG